MMTKSQPSRSVKHKLARRYAKAGLLVLPLYETRNGVCSCRNPECFSPGKHPRLKHGVKQASSDLASIDQWWTQWPDANIGIATGHIVCVFDVDLDKDGDKSLRWLEVAHGRLPKTWTTVTGGGGRHFFFKMPEEELKNAVKLWKRPGLDFRGTSGYVVAVGSETNKGAYSWMQDLAPWEVELADLPGYILQQVRHGVKIRHVRKQHPQKVEISSFGAIEDGERNCGLTRIAGHLIASGKDFNTSRTLLSAANEMLCKPPLDEREVDCIHASIWRREHHGG
jgi:putative DNA primase/helicase